MVHDDVSAATEHFHSRFNRVIAVVAWVVSAVGVSAILVSGRTDSFAFIGVLVLISYLAWFGLWRPAVVISDEGVELVNVSQTVLVPWAALIQVETRLALTLKTPRASYVATAAPAPGRTFTGVNARRAASVSGETAQPSDSPTSDSGAAAHLVRARWAALIESNAIELGVADEVPVVRRWNVAYLAIAAVLVVASAVLLAVG